VEKPLLVALDFESVLVPEFWPAIADAAGEPALRRTTRDEPDYHALLRERFARLRRCGLTLAQVQAILAGLQPLDGAAAFLARRRARGPVVILSDTFAEFARPLLAQLAEPLLLCHTLTVDDTGFISGWHERCPDSKAATVRALRGLGYRVAAVGDSHNDLAMLQAADHGCWLQPPAALAQAHPAFPVCRDYADVEMNLGGLTA
jgi:phosphoserine / homoserine phosphotransferase